MAVIIVALSALLVWSQLEAAKIKDYKLYKNVISQDEVEHTLFGQPISAERNGEYRIGRHPRHSGDHLLTESTGKSGITDRRVRDPAFIRK